MTLINTAEIYGNGRSEKLIGHVIAGQRDRVFLGSGLIDHSQKMTMAAMQIADMKVWAHRS